MIWKYKTMIHYFWQRCHSRWKCINSPLQLLARISQELIWENGQSGLPSAKVFCCRLVTITPIFPLRSFFGVAAECSGSWSGWGLNLSQMDRIRNRTITKNPTALTSPLIYLLSYSVPPPPPPPNSRGGVMKRKERPPCTNPNPNP